jgi:hypothetical protein
MSSKDIEADGETTRLIKGRPWLDEFENVPVGGVPGNDKFYDQVALAGRTAFFASVLASAIWIPATATYVDEGFLRYIPFAILMMIFTMNWVFGNIVGASTAAIIGTFWPVLNIFLLRGFFPDGVTPGMSFWSLPSIVGWLDIMAFNFIFLTTDLRMGVRMFAMGQNTGFMLCFLNPADQTVFSKNFVINQNGTAVMCLKMTIIACFLTMAANLLPTPFKFATFDMKDGAKRVSAYVAKSYIGAVDYYKGSERTCLIQRAIKNTSSVEEEVGSLGSSISGAFYEGFDVGMAGKVRFLHDLHHTLLGELLNIQRALQIAISTEDFAESHVTIMKKIGEPCSQLVEDTGDLLMTVTGNAGDGDLDAGEKKTLTAKVAGVKADLKAVGKMFNESRQTFIPNAPSIHREVMSESFFVFAISAYARKVCEFTEELLADKVVKKSWTEMLWESFKGTFTLSGVGDFHSKIALRSWCALMVGMIYGVTLDNYSGACAVTLVFLISNRVAPDIWTLLKGLIASVCASVMTAILYQRACMTGLPWMLPLCAFCYWWLMLYVHFSGCQFALIGLLGAALSPFVLVVQCPSPDEVVGSAAALPLWYSIRGFMMALLIMSVAEYMSSFKTMSELASKELDDVLGHMQDALKAIWNDEDPADEMSPIAHSLSLIKDWNVAAKSEPRFWNCKWKGDLMDEIVRVTEILQLDFSTIRHAMSGADGHTGGVTAVIKDIDGFVHMEKDIEDTLQDAKDLTFMLLSHKNGPLTGFEEVMGKGDVDTLDGVDDAIAQCGKSLPFPTEEIETIEDDLIVQISIIFLMLETVTGRIGGITKSCVRRC